MVLRGPGTAAHRPECPSSQAETTEAAGAETTEGAGAETAEAAGAPPRKRARKRRGLGQLVTAAARTCSFLPRDWSRLGSGPVLTLLVPRSLLSAIAVVPDVFLPGVTGEPLVGLPEISEEEKTKLKRARNFAAQTVLNQSTKVQAEVAAEAQRKSLEQLQREQVCPWCLPRAPRWAPRAHPDV